MGEQIQVGQWVLHLTNAPEDEKLWRRLDAIDPDPFGNPDVVVLKFSNGDGDRLHRDHLDIVNGAMFDTPCAMWEVRDTEPTDRIATRRLASRWLCEGELIELKQYYDADEQWTEATLNGYGGRQVTEIPAEALNALHSHLVTGTWVAVVVPALSSGMPGITEVRVDGHRWSSEEGVPVSRGFLNAYRIVEEADHRGARIVAFAHLDHQPLP
jgi:hypothetical protein